MNLSRITYRKANQLIKRGYWFNNVKFKDCRKFWNYRTFGTEVINLGSSSSINAFNYSGIPLKCANWALSSNPLAGDLAILKNYVSYLNTGATILIPLCPFTSLAGSYKITEDRYYSLLYPSTIPEYSIRRHNVIRSEIMSPLHSYPILSLFRDIKHLFIKEKQILLSEHEMEEDAKKWISNWKKEFSIFNFSYPLSLKNQDSIIDAAEYLNELIVFSKERNFNPIIVLPPIYHTLGELITPEIRKTVIDSLIEKVNDKSIIFKDYLNDNEFIYNRDIFRNSFFLNDKGASLFTKRVLSDLHLT